MPSSSSDQELRAAFAAEASEGLRHLSMRVTGDAEVELTAPDANDPSSQEWFSWPVSSGAWRADGESDASWRARFMAGVAEAAVLTYAHEVFEFMRDADGARMWSPHGEDGSMEHPLTGENCPVVRVDVLALAEAVR